MFGGGGGGVCIGMWGCARYTLIQSGIDVLRHLASVLSFMSQGNQILKAEACASSVPYFWVAMRLLITGLEVVMYLIVQGHLRD